MKEIADVLTGVEEYCKENELPHFMMSAEDDIDTVQKAFEHVINGSLRISLQKRR